MSNVSVRSLPDGIADLGPLGLAGFAMTTLVLSVFNVKLSATRGWRRWSW